MRTALILGISIWYLASNSAAQSLVDAPSLQATPDYFDTASDGPYPGPTATGEAPFLAATNPIPGAGLPTGTRLFIANAPIETTEAIINNTEDINIFEYMGNLSPYFPNRVGFGVEEYSLPSNCEITQVHVLSRHGSRYPSSGNSLEVFAAQLQNATAFNASGSLAYPESD
jgi:hypothetical protein